jgi:hypothetical protein
MRAVAALFLAGWTLFAIWGCSRNATPPEGSWEGTVTTPDVMVAVRLQITPKGEIFLSAPNVQDISAVPDADRDVLRRRLSQQLLTEWGTVEPRHFDFDGRIFRKPGGIAPQMEWNPQTQQMSVMLYLGMHAAIRVPVRRVDNFSDDPWGS